MKRLAVSVAILVLTMFSLIGCSTGDNNVQKENVTLRLFADVGWGVHKSTAGISIHGVYRYGPCLILNDDGSLDMYTASPGNVHAEWDWGRYRHSDDGGKTWGDEVVAVKPTPGQMDSVSTCDPGVFKMGEYYYAGYTSTYEAGGVNNMIFIARSKSAKGPFYEKWTGDGWSLYESRPAMIYDGDPESFGIGEPAFVVNDGKIYMYYNWWDKTPEGEEVSQTRVALADADNENWPATLKEHGVAFNKAYGGEDSSDIKYIEEYDKYIAVNTAKRFTEDSFIAVYESDDGLTFTPSTVIRRNIAKYCHNMGLSGDAQGHIKKGDDIYLAYAYSAESDSWANWHTRMHKVTLSAVEKGTEDSQLTASNILKPAPAEFTYGGTAIETLHSREPVMYVGLNNKSAKITLWTVDNNYSDHIVTGSNLIKYDVADEDILSVLADGTIVPKNTGQTYVKAVYNNEESAYALIKISVIDTPFDTATASEGAEGLEFLNNGGTYDTARIPADCGNAWFAVMGTRSLINGVAIFPKYQGNGWSNSISVEYSDGGVWKPVPELQNVYFNASQASSVTPFVYRFQTPIECEGIRVVRTGELPEGASHFEVSELIALTGEMAEIAFTPMREEYVLDESKTFAQIMLEGVWSFGFCREYYGERDGVTYTVADENIVKVSKDGLLTPVQKGTTTVIATIFGQKVSCKVTVK